jgi:hypothetical protein
MNARRSLQRCGAWAGNCLILLAAVISARGATNQFSFDDVLIAGLRVHLLTSSNSPALETTLSGKDIGRIVGKLNGVWAQAGLHFYVESILREQANEPATHAEAGRPPERSGLPALRPEASRATNLFHVYYIKEMSVNGIYFPEGIFVKDTASLKAVEGGIDEPLPRVTSHELGHALGLAHRQHTTNLLASGTTGTWLNEEEIRQAREAARKYGWIEPAGELMKRANALFNADKRSEAAVFYSRIATMALRVEQVELARKRAGVTTDEHR